MSLNISKMVQKQEFGSMHVLIALLKIKKMCIFAGRTCIKKKSIGKQDKRPFVDVEPLARLS